MRESRTYGSVRGALSNERPYRVTRRNSRCHAPRASRRRARRHNFGANYAGWALMQERRPVAPRKNELSDGHHIQGAALPVASNGA